ncbi:patatin-like phospholipase domain-containing protein 4 isoform X2 [Candoia aspera]|uniref:patatin-like phospholipase domain-containing protein 4 isoform X2 n=1 Tax=Candoia aspera TaxID=51853 RepID=UPI002FD836ED
MFFKLNSFSEFKGMWATKRIYRSPRQWLRLKQDGLHNSLCRATSFENSGQCYVLQALHLLSTCTVSQFQKTWFIMDTTTDLSVTEESRVNKKSSKSLDGGRHLEIEATMKHLNLSFAASGFLGIYHLGAASALCRHGKKLLKIVKAFAGASSGALTATVLLTVPESIETCTNITYQLAEDTRKLYFGALTPGYDLMTKLGGYIDSILPPNAHEIAENRLFVSVTSTKNGKNYLLSNFASREDLIKKWIDGGLTNGLPILPKGRTVTISPFCGRLDICPQNKGRVDIYAKVAKQDIMLSITNFVRLHQALFPPSQEKMESLHQDGYDDAIHFLLKENWFE